MELVLYKTKFEEDEYLLKLVERSSLQEKKSAKQKKGGYHHGKNVQRPNKEIRGGNL